MATVIPFPSRAKAPPAPAMLPPEAEQLARDLRGHLRNRATGEPCGEAEVQAFVRRLLDGLGKRGIRAR